MNTVVIWHSCLYHCKCKSLAVAAELSFAMSVQLCVLIDAGFRCDNYQKQHTGNTSRTQRVLSEASERLLSEFALRHGIVCITVLTFRRSGDMLFSSAVDS